MRVVIITGGSRGIGAALAREFLSDPAEQWHVALMATSASNLDRCRAELGAVLSADQIKKRVFCLECDVSQNDQVVAAVKSVADRWGRVDVAVANAGISMPSGSRSSVVSAIHKVFGVNFFGAVYLFDAVIPLMKSAGSGYLAAVSSLASFDSIAPFHGYCASKAALNRWVEGLDQEVRPFNIRVHNFCPGFVKTEMIDGQKLPMPLLLQAKDAARIIFTEIRKDRSGIKRFPMPLSLAMYLLQFVPYSLMNAIKARMGKRK